MKRNILLVVTLLFIISQNNFSQITLPIERNNYTKVTSYEEMISYLEGITSKNNLMEMSYIAESVEGRKVPVIKISNSEVGKDSSKITILIFAQQHGNEQSGKEGALLFLKDIFEGKLNYLFDKIDLLVVPQMNPDGSEKNERRNGNDKDLNRNHLSLTQPETYGLHKLYNEFLPEATLDVHEYYPYGESWEKFGYIKYFDEQFGTATNPNVSKEIRNYSKEKFLPFIIDYLKERNFTANEYLLGGPPNEERMRYSTYDINDGRQSFASMNNFSFILEGRNGKDAFVENIKHRAEGQRDAIEGFVQFIYQNRDKIKILVIAERKKIIFPQEGEKVAIRMEHVPSDEPVEIVFHSLSSRKDTLIEVRNFDSNDKIILEVEKPLGYLIPKSLTEIVDVLKRHNIKFHEFHNTKEFKIEQYYISKIDSIILEELTLPDPIVEQRIVNNGVDLSEMIFVPTNQICGDIIVQALEPQSMVGFATYETVYGEFKNFIKENWDYPILRVLNKN